MGWMAGCGETVEDGKRMVHKWWCGAFRLPTRSGVVLGWMIRSSVLYIFMFVLVKIAVQFASHIFPTDNSDPEASFGKPWAVFALIGS